MWERHRSSSAVSMFLLSCSFFIVSTSAQEKCLVDFPEVFPKIKVVYMGLNSSVIVETSNRPLQMIETEIFKIFIKEVVGFSNVTSVTYSDNNFHMDSIVDRLSPGPGEEVVFPTSMINLDVWVSADTDLVPLENAQLVREYGNIAYAGRFGWFIPKKMNRFLSKLYTKNFVRNDIIKNGRINGVDMAEVHWTLLKDRSIMADFDVDSEVLDKYLLLGSNGYNCNASECIKGLYTPPWCSKSTCATLLTSYYNITAFVIDHIKQQNLFVRVAFLGDNLKETVDALTRSYSNDNAHRNKSLMILDMTPNDVVLHPEDFYSVTFPYCDHYAFGANVTSPGCYYEVRRRVKLAWSKIDNIRLLHPTANFKFETNEYDDLIRLYEEYVAKLTNGADVRSNLRSVACRWMREHKRTWIGWKGDNSVSPIYIGGIFPISNSSYNGASIVKAAFMATDAVNANSSILSNYNLRLIVSNGKCRPDTVMRSFIDYIVDGYYNNLIGVLGPACSDTVEPLAGVSKHYRIMVISYSAEGASFSDREKYPFFFRTIGENKHYKHVYLKLFKELKWTRIFALTEDGQKYTEYISHMAEMLEENGIKVSNTKFARERGNVHMTRYLEDLKRQRARIIILDVFDEIARTVLCAASKLHMTQRDGYVWFLPNWLNKTWYEVDYFNERNGERVNCTSQEMLEAVQGYLSLAHSFYAPDDKRVEGNMSVAEWKAKYNADPQVNKTGPSDYAGYAYDAVWVYALALDKLIKMDLEAASDLHSENTTSKLVKLIEATDFHGVSGRIKFRGGPSRFSIINLRQFQNTSIHIVGFFNPNLTDDQPEILGGTLEVNFGDRNRNNSNNNLSTLQWFTRDHKRPTDGELPSSVCALESLAKLFSVDCEMAIVILNLLVGFLFVLLVGILVYSIKRRYDQKMKFIKDRGIDFLFNPDSIRDLDKWEIPRDLIVINRKLGEGAFGSVYGGEAKLPPNNWFPIAVKTLKKAANTEEKLDFLAEAEMMKRFDHKNIVRLIGVCARDEPIYTVMEFMMYGDMKMYLLNRRHLVHGDDPGDEVSPKRLTSMCLDVARGLSYLAEMKYVHRDVASRNCLIGTNRVAKLADFGLTRPVCDNDYYKFNRKGMMPVRWMAPEALDAGVFTPASDVWSFGVFLYETITFGSFPYQGLTNMEALEFVKKGNLIAIPDGVKPQLRILMSLCWKFDPKARIKAKEIVDFLANNPRLIAPCLDVPMASVHMDGTDQLEIKLPDQFRKCSTSDMKSHSPIENGGPTIFAQDLENRHRSFDYIDKLNDDAIPMTDNCCPKEPLLATSKSSTSLLNFGRYASGNLSGEQMKKKQEQKDDYMTKAHDDSSV